MESQKSTFDISTYSALSICEGRALMEMFRWFHRITCENEIEWYAQCGTMLGAIRCGGLIKWDDDIDIAIESQHYDKLKDCRTRLEKGSWKGVYPPISRPKNGEEDKRRPPIYALKYVGQYCKLELISSRDDTGEAKLWIDIFKVHNGIYPQKHCQGCNAPDDMRLPLRKVSYGGLSIKVPNKAEELLDREFPNWRTEAVIYNHQAPKKKIIKGEVVYAKWGGYQSLGTYPLTPEIDKPLI